MASTGAQFVWAIQVGTATAAFRKLRLPDTQVNFAWLAGPVSGVVVHPLIGAFSDRCESSLGKRWPFLIPGPLAVGLFVVLFSQASAVGRFLSDLSGIGEQSSWLARLFALFAFWGLDISVNIIQGPMRALLTGTASTYELPMRNALLS